MGPVWDIAFSSDGKHLASGGNDGTARIWDLATGLHVLTATQKDAIQAVAFGIDGKIIASGQGQSIKVWNATDGELVREIPARLAMVRDLSFSPDGMTLASAGNDSSIALWDVETGAPKAGSRPSSARR